MGHKKNNPTQTLERLERWSARATLGILAGIVIEIGLLLWFPKPTVAETIGSITANALIGVGLAVEYLVILRAIIATREENRLSEEKVADANKRAAEANQKAQEAVLELANLRAPRALTTEQRGRIVDKVKPYSGTEYDITISDSDPEILTFVLIIELILSTAGWTELDWQGNGQGFVREGMPIIRLGVSVANVVIGVYVSQPLRLLEYALALSDALVAEGIDATATRMIPIE